MNTQRITHRFLIVLMLLNGCVSALLWGGTGMRVGGALSASVPSPLNRRLVMSIMPVDTRIRSYPNYPVTYDDNERGSPNHVWVHVWTQNSRQQTFTNYIFVMLPLCHLALGHLLAVTLPLTLLALGLFASARLRRVKRVT